MNGVLDGLSPDELDENMSLTVHGYRFLSLEDANAARLDLDRIGQLEKYLKNARGGNVRPLYEKCLSNHLFSTPVGWEYLQELRGMMIGQGERADEIESIPIGVPITKRAQGTERVRERIVPTPPPPMPLSMKTSLIANIILVVLVILMFVIASTSKTDNILNYRRNVTNEYSSWAEELTLREKAVREKERVLGIDPKGQ